MRKIKLHPFHRFIYWFCRFLCLILFKFIWRLRIKGLEHVPKQGAVLLAANHKSYADPPLVGVAMNRPIHFMAKEELFYSRFFGWLITNLNAHPLNRTGSDIAALKMAKQILSDQQPLIVFPEGHRIRGREFGAAKAGVGLLSKLTQSPIVPIFIDNNADMWKLRRLTVVFGKPLKPDGFESNQDLANAVMAEIKKLKESLHSS